MLNMIIAEYNDQSLSTEMHFALRRNFLIIKGLVKAQFT
jgi:hypothetical protein